MSLKALDQVPPTSLRATGRPERSIHGHRPSGTSAGASSAAFRAPVGSHDLGAISVRASGASPGVSAGAHQPIQRVISLYGEDEDRDANVARLNALLGNSGGRVKREAGNVVFDAHPDPQTGKKHPSYRLLKRMIEHQHVALIGIDPNRGESGPVATAYHAENARKLGTGSSAFIHMPKVAKPTATTVYDKVSNKFESENAPEYLQFGHELIHADHAQRGTLTPYDQEVESVARGELAGYGAFDTTVREKQEERVTIGTSLGHDSDDITENKLRVALGHRPRAWHDRIEMHLLHEQGKLFEQAKKEHGELHKTALDHRASSEHSRAWVEYAQSLIEEAKRKEEHHRQSARDSLEIVEGLRGDSKVSDEFGKSADAHQADADQATSLADEMALAAAAHEQERDGHAAEFETHKANFDKTLDAFKAKEEVLKGHQANAEKLKKLLGIQ